MFEYTCKLSLWINHPTADLSQVPERLGFPASRIWKAGDPRFRPDGKALSGTNRNSYCNLTLQDERVGSLPELLRTVLPRLAHHKPVLDELTSQGAAVSLFVGWFSEESNSRDVIEWELLAEMARLKISLDLDFYGPQPTASPDAVREDKGA